MPISPRFGGFGASPMYQETQAALAKSAEEREARKQKTLGIIQGIVGGLPVVGGLVGGIVNAVGQSRSRPGASLPALPPQQAVAASPSPSTGPVLDDPEQERLLSMLLRRR